MRGKYSIAAAAMLAAVLMAATATAEPKAVVTVPNVIPEGGVAFVNTEGSVGEVTFVVFPTEAAGYLIRLPIFEGLDAKKQPIIRLAALLNAPPPGEYFLVVVASADGSIDAAGAKLTVRSGEEVIPPNPQPEPAPQPGRRWLIVIEESQQRTTQQAQVINSLRIPQQGGGLATYLDGKGHQVAILDRDQPAQPALAPYLEAAGDLDLPCVFIVDEAGTVLAKQPLPGTADDLLALLKSKGG